MKRLSELTDVKSLLLKRLILHISRIDRLSDPRWEAFVQNHNAACLYHSSAWGQVLQRAFQYSPFYFVIQNGRDDIESGIPIFLINSAITGKRLVSLPFSDYCDPLVENQLAFNSLIEHIFRFAKQCNARTVVFKTSHSASFFQSPNTCSIDSYKNHRLSLMCPNRIQLNCGIDEIFKKFHKGQVQRSIRKSLESDLEVGEAKTEAELKIFYDLVLRTRKKHGLLPQPYRFFSSLWHTLGKNGLISILLAHKGPRPVAGIMLAQFKDVMYYLYGGSNPNDLIDRPYHLLLWRSIQKAFSEGFRYFDFGRTSLDNIGLLDFKRRWGTHETDIHYFDDCKRGNSSFLMKVKSNLPGVVRKAVSKFPPLFLKLSSDLIYKHLVS